MGESNHKICSISIKYKISTYICAIYLLIVPYFFLLQVSLIFPVRNRVHVSSEIICLKTYCFQVPHNPFLENLQRSESPLL